jgi:hypothetical protein
MTVNPTGCQATFSIKLWTHSDLPPRPQVRVLLGAQLLGAQSEHKFRI